VWGVGGGGGGGGGGVCGVVFQTLCLMETCEGGPGRRVAPEKTGAGLMREHLLEALGPLYEKAKRIRAKTEATWDWPIEGGLKKQSKEPLPVGQVTRRSAGKKNSKV